jgi:hypothetical protein
LRELRVPLNACIGREVATRTPFKGGSGSKKLPFNDVEKSVCGFFREAYALLPEECSGEPMLSYYLSNVPPCSRALLGLIGGVWAVYAREA